MLNEQRSRGRTFVFCQVGSLSVAGILDLQFAVPDGGTYQPTGRRSRSSADVCFRIQSVADQAFFIWSHVADLRVATIFTAFKDGNRSSNKVHSCIVRQLHSMKWMFCIRLAVVDG